MFCSNLTVSYLSFRTSAILSSTEESFKHTPLLDSASSQTTHSSRCISFPPLFFLNCPSFWQNHLNLLYRSPLFQTFPPFSISLYNFSTTTLHFSGALHNMCSISEDVILRSQYAYCWDLSSTVQVLNHWYTRRPWPLAHPQTKSLSRHPMRSKIFCICQARYLVIPKNSSSHTADYQAPALPSSLFLLAGIPTTEWVFLMQMNMTAITWRGGPIYRTISAFTALMISCAVLFPFSAGLWLLAWRWDCLIREL